MRAVLAAFCILLCASPRCWSATLRIAQYDHAAWTSRDGAPNDILALAEDRDGSLWILAGSGLYNFDGRRFAIVDYGLDRNAKLRGAIGAIVVTSDGCLWLGSRIKGVARVCSGKVVRSYDESDGLPGATVKQLVQAPDATIYAIAKDHLVRLRGDRWDEVVLPGPLSSQVIVRVFFDHEGRLWVLSESDIWYRAPGEDQGFQKTAETGSMFGTFAQQPDGSIWVMKNVLGQEPAEIQRVFLVGSSSHPERVKIAASDFISDDAGTLWIAADNGIAKFDWSNVDAARQGASIVGSPPLNTFTRADGMTGDATVVMQDSSGDIWAGGTRGIDRFKIPRLVRFTDERLAVDPAITVCPSGTIWTATHDQPLHEIRGDLVIDHGPAREANALFCDRAETLWVASEGKFWHLRNGVNEAIQPPDGLSAFFFRQFIDNHRGGLYVSITRNGLWSFDAGRWARISAQNFPTIPPITMLVDGKERLWTGYIDDQIAVLDHGIGRTFSGGQQSPLGAIQSFLDSRNGLLAAGTNGVAIFREDRFQSLLTDDANAVNGVSGMLEAPNGDLWLNSLHGIVRVPAAEIVRAITTPQYKMRTELFDDAGVTGPSNQILKIPSAVADGNGRFWFATSATVVSIDPSSIKPRSDAPKLGRISMTVDGNPVANDSSFLNGEHTVRVSYLGIYLAAPEKVGYQYRLDGLDTDWQSVGTRAEAVYTGLPPGHYRFHVMASNGEGVWTPSNDEIQFTVSPRFYQTTWFALTCIGCALLAVWALARFRIAQITNRIRQSAEARVDERIRIARDLHDTLLQGVQGLMLRFHAAAQGISDDVRTRENLDVALVTADRILVEARDKVSRLRASESGELDLAENFEKVGADLNYENAIAFSVTTRGAVRRLRPEVQEEMYFIGREAITNAFRHADAATIAATLDYSQKALVATFRDDGCGFHAPAERLPERSLHWGISGMMERAHRIGATFECRSAPGTGTTIIVAVSGRKAFGN
jgi:signal transduction histidine kinase/ligand-binding sensor domain-containing protein